MEFLKKDLGQSVIDGAYSKAHNLDHSTVLDEHYGILYNSEKS